MRAHFPAIISVQETKSWDVTSLELPGYVLLRQQVWVRNVVGFLNSSAQIGDHGSLIRDVQPFSSGPPWWRQCVCSRLKQKFGDV